MTADEEYQRSRLDVARKTGLDEIARSPLHYWTWVHVGKKETPTLAFGKALHCAVLEPEVFAKRYVVAQDFVDCRYKANKEAKEQWAATVEGKIILDADDGETITAMTDAVRKHPKASMLRRGVAEMPLEWTDLDTGVKCKCKPDYYRKSLALAVDLKTTEDASPEAFARSVATYRYHVQAAFYREGLRANEFPCDHFVFVCVEKRAPYAVGIYELDDDAIEAGRRAAAANLQTLAECLATDTWPGYDHHIVKLSLPKWAA
jgi:hypothetical protein